jgi:hypothetical protein
MCQVGLRRNSAPNRRDLDLDLVNRGLLLRGVFGETCDVILDDETMDEPQTDQPWALYLLFVRVQDVEQSETVRNMPWEESIYGGEHYECLLLRESHRQHNCFERVGFVCFDMPWPRETKHEKTYQALEDGVHGQNVPRHLYGLIDDTCRYSITLI